MIAEGTSAPDFDLITAGDDRLRLRDLRGRWVVLWWFPKASTPGCTAEGRGFRQLADAFAARGASIVGASFDEPAESAEFAANECFPYPLVCDPRREVGATYGVRKRDDEERAQFARRTTFLIDDEGIVRAVYRDIGDRGAHAQVVLDDLIRLTDEAEASSRSGWRQSGSSA